MPVDDLAAALVDLHGHGLRIVGADEDAPLTVREVDLRGPLALVVGSEGTGIGSKVRRRVDLVARIPMRGRVGSLNAAVAGSILLFEAVAQRGPVTGPAEAGLADPTPLAVDDDTVPEVAPRADASHGETPGDTDDGDAADAPPEVTSELLPRRHRSRDRAERRAEHDAARGATERRACAERRRGRASRRPAERRRRQRREARRCCPRRHRSGRDRRRPSSRAERHGRGRRTPEASRLRPCGRSALPSCVAADVAQLVEQRFCKPPVPGSSPVVGSISRCCAPSSTTEGYSSGARVPRVG